MTNDGLGCGRDELDAAVTARLDGSDTGVRSSYSK